MKSTEFIVEGPGFVIGMDLYEPDANDKDIEKWKTLIQQNCQPFLKQANGEKLYRGLGLLKEPFTEMKVRLGNRKPTDMPQIVHNKLNKFFTMKYGAPFRNAMFATGATDEAAEYGKVYKVYPIGKFEFLWSPEVQDLYTEWVNNGYTSVGDSSTVDQQNSLILKKFHDEVLVPANYTMTNLPNAIKSHHEIMIRCSSYYAVRDDVDLGI